MLPSHIFLSPQAHRIPHSSYRLQRNAHLLLASQGTQGTSSRFRESPNCSPAPNASGTALTLTFIPPKFSLPSSIHPSAFGYRNPYTHFSPSTSGFDSLTDTSLDRAPAAEGIRSHFPLDSPTPIRGNPPSSTQ